MIVIDTDALAKFYNGLMTQIRNSYYSQDDCGAFFAHKSGDSEVPFATNELDVYSGSEAASVTFDAEIPAFKLMYNGITLSIPVVDGTVALNSDVVASLVNKANVMIAGNYRLTKDAIPSVVYPVVCSGFIPGTTQDSTVASAITSEYQSVSAGQVFAVCGGSLAIPTGWRLYVITSVDVSGASVSLIGSPSKHTVYYVSHEDYGFCIFDGTTFSKKVTTVINNIYEGGGDISIEGASDEVIEAIINGTYVITDDDAVGEPGEETLDD